jgi:hypothetical protein
MAASRKAYRLNRYLHRMIEPAHRRAFLADPEATFAEAGLSEEECDLVQRRDWRGPRHIEPASVRDALGVIAVHAVRHQAMQVDVQHERGVLEEAEKGERFGSMVASEGCQVCRPSRTTPCPTMQPGPARPDRSRSGAALRRTADPPVPCSPAP